MASLRESKRGRKTEGALRHTLLFDLDLGRWMVRMVKRTIKSQENNRILEVLETEGRSPQPAPIHSIVRKLLLN